MPGVRVFSLLTASVSFACSRRIRRSLILAKESEIETMATLEAATKGDIDHATKFPATIPAQITWDWLVAHYTPKNVPRGREIVSIPSLDEYEEIEADHDDDSEHVGNLAQQLKTLFQLAGFGPKLGSQQFERVTWRQVEDDAPPISRALYGTGDARYIISLLSYNYYRLPDDPGLPISELPWQAWKHVSGGDPQGLMGIVSYNMDGKSGTDAVARLKVDRDVEFRGCRSKPQYAIFVPGSRAWYTILGGDNFRSWMSMLIDHRREVGSLKPVKIIVDFGTSGGFATKMHAVMVLGRG